MALTSTGTQKRERQTNQLQYGKGLNLLSSAPGIPEKFTPENSQGLR